MKFVRGTTSAAEQAVTGAIAAALRRHNRVLWLVSGGSLVPLQVTIADTLRRKVPRLLHRLAIFVVDERYGAPGHEDSNTAKMRAAGFAPGNAAWVDILAANLPLEATLDRYQTLTKKAFAAADYVIATCGLGADGHTAGILAGSPCLQESDTDADVISYTTPEHIRLTLTPHQIKKCDTVYICTYGPAKRVAIERLHAHKETPLELPAAFYWDMPDVTVYNDVLSSGKGST